MLSEYGSVIIKATALPVVEDVDVVVCGGGPSGLSAAINSARKGVKTLLIERAG
ncbi:MAG: FAD-dependent oxidoreductase, partial [Treponema sp.]|nr:FAD-dependent oxidoreductase [Treponema sp.]